MLSIIIISLLVSMLSFLDKRGKSTYIEESHVLSIGIGSFILIRIGCAVMLLLVLLEGQEVNYQIPFVTKGASSCILILWIICEWALRRSYIKINDDLITISTGFTKTRIQPNHILEIRSHVWGGFLIYYTHEGKTKRIQILPVYKDNRPIFELVGKYRRNS